MRKSIISIVVLSAVSGSSIAATGMFSADPNAPASNYDVIQDKANLASSTLANSALSQIQQTVIQIKTNIAGIGSNAQAIGQTNTLVGQNKQSIQQNAQNINTLKHDVARQASVNIDQDNQIAALQSAQGNFVTKSVYDAGQKTQDDALAKETAARHGDVNILTNRLADKVDLSAYNIDKAAQKAIDKAQDTKLTAINHKNQTQDGLITGLRTDVDANTKGVADNKSAIATKVDNSVFTADQQRQDGLIAGKADQSALDATNAQVAVDGKNITKVNDGLIKEIADRKAGDTTLQSGIDANSKLIATKANSAQVNALAVSTHAEDVRLQGEVDKKVDKTTYDANKRLVDANIKHIGDVNTQQTTDIAANKTAIGTKASQSDLTKESNDRQSADKQHTSDIAANKSAIADRVTKSDFLKDQKRQDADLVRGLSQKVDNSVFTQRSAVVDNRFADTDARIAETKAAQRKTDAVVAKHSAQLSDHERRITDLEARTNKGFASLKSEIDQNKKDADAGIAGVAAMANIPQVTESQTFSVGAGVGERNGQSAVAVGFSARVSQNVVTKTTIAADTNSGFTVGAGISYGW